MEERKRRRKRTDKGDVEEKEKTIQVGKSREGGKKRKRQIEKERMRQ